VWGTQTVPEIEDIVEKFAKGAELPQSGWRFYRS